MDKPKLLPCPFEAHHRFKGKPYELYVSCDSVGFRVHCSRCGTVSPAFVDKAKAVECWNTRTASPAAEQMLEALKRCEFDFDVLTTRGDIAEEPRAYETLKIIRTAITNYEAQKND